MSNNQPRILVVGIHKSGTSILAYRILKGLRKAKLHFEPKSIEAQSNILLHQRLTGGRRPIVTKVLFYPAENHCLKSISNFYSRKIWIFRDIRDWAISSFFYYWYRGHKPDKKLFLDTLANVKIKEKAPLSVPFHKLLLPNITHWYKQAITETISAVSELDSRWLMLKYEDFIGQNIEPLNRYLGFSVEQSAEVHHKFNRVIRSKSYGNWRNWFTPEDVLFFEPIFKEYLDFFGYDSKDWNLEPVDTLSPETGSDYMEKIFYLNRWKERFYRLLPFRKA